MVQDNLSFRPPTPAKIQRPRLARVYERAHLFQRLDRAADRPLAWIGAPAGSGKTSLVSSYVEARRIRHVWYTMDVRDADPATFFYYLRLAVQRRAPRKAATLPLLTPEYQLGLEAFARNFFEQMWACLKLPATLVIDNYQELPESALLHGILAKAVSVLPSGGRIVCVSRTDAPPEFACIRAAQQLAALGGNDLNLSAAEARHIGRLCAPREISAARIEELNERSRGWAAGLILLLEQTAASAEMGANDVSEAVFDYFAAEIMRAAPAEVQQFLVRAALLPEMDADSAAELTDEARAEEILRGLARRNHFTVRRPGVTITYQFHPLFREFLLAELRRRTGSEDLLKVQRHAARILARQGSYEAAAAIFAAAADAGGLAELVLSQAQALVEQGRHPLLAQWIEAIPETKRERHPWLLYWQGVAIQWRDPLSARDCFDHAFAAMDDEQMAVARALIWSAAIDTYLITFAEFHSLDQWIDRLGFFTPERFARLPQEVYARLAAAIFIALIYRQPGHPDLPAWARKVEEIFYSTGNQELRFYIGNHLLIYVTWWVGDMGRARTLLQSLPRADSGIDPRMEILHSAFKAGLCWMLGENQEAVDAASHGLALAAANGFHIWDVFLASQAAFASLSANDLDAANSSIENILARLDHSRYLEAAWAMYAQAWNEELAGRRDEAMATLRYVKEVLDRAGTPYFAAVAYNDLGRLLVLGGRREEGMDLIAKARDIGDAIDSDPIRYLVARALAEIAERDGADAQFVEASRVYLEIGRRRGFRSHAGWRAEAMARMYAKALEFDVETEFVIDIVRRRRLLPPVDLPGSDSWPYAVKVRTFGRFSVLVDGQPVHMEKKAQQKPLALLRVLIALGGDGVPEDKLADVLWSDADADRARHSLKANLHRLRRLIGTDSIVLHDGKLTLDRQHIWVDTFAFDAVAKRVTDALRSDRIADAVDSGQRLLSLYQGAFLAADELSCIYAARERFRGRLLGFIDQLARALYENGRPDDSIVFYRAGLDIDPLTEQFYQGLIRCHLQQGQAAEALKIYARCRDLLQRELGLDPAPATEALAEAARSPSR